MFLPIDTELKKYACRYTIMIAEDTGLVINHCYENIEKLTQAGQSDNFHVAVRGTLLHKSCVPISVVSGPGSPIGKGAALWRIIFGPLP